jgi:hypothetical protein
MASFEMLSNYILLLPTATLANPLRPASLFHWGPTEHHKFAVLAPGEIVEPLLAFFGSQVTATSGIATLEESPRHNRHVATAALACPPRPTSLLRGRTTGDSQFPELTTGEIVDFLLGCFGPQVSAAFRLASRKVIPACTNCRATAALANPLRFAFLFLGGLIEHGKLAELKAGEIDET